MRSKLMRSLRANWARGAAYSRRSMHGANGAHLVLVHHHSWPEDHRYRRLMNLPGDVSDHAVKLLRKKKRTEQGRRRYNSTHGT